MSTEALEDSAKAGRRMRSSASWILSLEDMEDMSNVTDHLLPICWQPERDECRKLVSINYDLHRREQFVILRLLQTFPSSRKLCKYLHTSIK